MSDALEQVFGRHVADIRSINGVYRAALGEHSEMVSNTENRIKAFANAERTMCMLLARVHSPLGT